MSILLLRRLAEHAETHGDAVAIVESDERGGGARSVRFAELASAVEAFGCRLASRFEGGDVLMVCLPNCAECTVAMLGALRAGMTALLVSPDLSAAELLGIEALVQPVAFVGNPSCSPGLAQVRAPSATADLEEAAATQGMALCAVPRGVERAGLMLVSSGTTGEPKVAYRTPASIDAVARNVATALALTQSDCVLAMIPLVHSYGVEHGIFAPTYAGARVHLCRGIRAPQMCGALDLGGVSVLPGVPAVFDMLSGFGNGEERFPQLRLALSAGSPLPMPVFEACLRRLRLRVGQLYGSSEVGSITFNDPHRVGHDPLSSGFAMEGVDLRILDPAGPDLRSPLPVGTEGELWVRSPSMLETYVGASSPLVEGFFATGDLARVSATGELSITGRLKLLIDVGARKVNPLEIERVLGRQPGVRECVVLPVRVTETISRLRALVVPEHPHAPPPIEQLRDSLRAELSAHKIPRLIEMVEKLPRSPTGKLTRRQLAS